jgi:hypothetical protein
MKLITTKMIIKGVIAGLGALAFMNPACAVEYFQLSSGSYFANYRGENAQIPVTEFRYGSYLSRAFSLELNLAIGTSSKTILRHGTTYDPNIANGDIFNAGQPSINWLGRDSKFASADVDFKLDYNFGVFGSYRWIVSRYDFAARAGLVQLAYNQTFHARDAQINGVYAKTYKEEIGSSDLGLAFGFSALALISQQISLVAELQLLPKVGDSVRDGDSTKVSATALQLGARFIF